MTQDELCTWEVLDGAVHRLTLHQSNRHSIDVLLEHLYQIIENAPPDEVLRTYIDESQASQMIPLNYLTSSLGNIAKKYPVRPPGRTAIIMRESLIKDLMAGLLRIVVRGRDNTRIFSPKEADEAMEWLRRDD